MTKFRFCYAFVPACIGFGPFFMVMPTFWHAPSLADSMLALGGAFMLSFGLYSIADIVFSQLVKENELQKRNSENRSREA